MIAVIEGGPLAWSLEHDAEKCEALFGRHHALSLCLGPDSDFRSIRPEIIRLQIVLTQFRTKSRYALFLELR
ncbi:hypothetical protein EN780_05570 [Mesorhizobium sp. M4B.F.Ca.ET.089.01.1.1]|nr:hypothetical protein EN780_05570 [Mesorhizobium sp. M4B.F.Ca.ET.089.01.1.1]TGV25466.1 hypothetical protein EN786_13800 [Mesorhizobium sp. M4B.F.Ca.ET.143.01.1.1]